MFLKPLYGTVTHYWSNPLPMIKKVESVAAIQRTQESTYQYNVTLSSNKPPVKIIYTATQNFQEDRGKYIDIYV